MIIVNSRPLLLIVNGDTLIGLDQGLNPIKNIPVRSASSTFACFDQAFFEINTCLDRVYCYNEQGRLVWRYTAAGSIRETAVTQHGLAIMTAETLAFLRLAQTAQPISELAEFLEIE